jgi:hypothetical protein
VEAWRFSQATDNGWKGDSKKTFITSDFTFIASIQGKPGLLLVEATRLTRLIRGGWKYSMPVCG